MQSRARRARQSPEARRADSVLPRQEKALDLHYQQLRSYSLRLHGYSKCNLYFCFHKFEPKKIQERLTEDTPEVNLVRELLAAQTSIYIDEVIQRLNERNFVNSVLFYKYSTYIAAALPALRRVNRVRQRRRAAHRAESHGDAQTVHPLAWAAPFEKIE